MVSPFRFSIKDSYRQAVEAQTGEIGRAHV